MHWGPRLLKILLTGILPTSVCEMGARLSKDGHQVTILGTLSKEVQRADVTAIYDMHPGDPDALRILEAAHFETVVFFFAFQCEDMREYGSVQGSVLDALFAMQHAAQQNGVRRFFLVTDRRVFSREQIGREDELPMPDTPTGMLIKAAEDCLLCGAQEGMATIIVRVTSLYAPGDTNSFFANANACARDGVSFRLPGNEKTPCDFLHVDDLALFLSMALETELSGIVHLAYGVRRTYGDMTAALKRYLPGLQVEYTGEDSRRGTLVMGAAQSADWVARHDCVTEMADLLSIDLQSSRVRKDSRWRRLVKRSAEGVMPWVEAAVLGAVFWALNSYSQTNAALRFVDYWLLYVALMGNIHGSLVGTVSALLACAAYAVEWGGAGNDLYLLLYNIDNWLPLVSYLMTGALFGYISDKRHERVTTLELEKQDRDSEARFLQTIYQQTYEDRNQLQEQVMRYRDSYGRIYQITRKLDSMQPQQIFLSTLDVMEDTLQNQSVAIYTRKADSPFARLVVHSRAVKQLPRSLDMDRLPYLKNCLDEGKLFANTSLRPGYPTFAAPISDDHNPVAMIMLWDVPFEKQTLYYQNLLSVVTGLVQSAMVRALRYYQASDDLYIKDTHILCDEAFHSVLSVYQNMRKQRTGSYLLVRLHGEEALTPTEFDQRIAKATRSTDTAGRMNDDEYYVLFPQATVENLPQISSRFAAQGIRCEVVAQEAAYV